MCLCTNTLWVQDLASTFLNNTFALCVPFNCGESASEQKKLLIIISLDIYIYMNVCWCEWQAIDKKNYFIVGLMIFVVYFSFFFCLWINECWTTREIKYIERDFFEFFVVVNLFFKCFKKRSLNDELTDQFLCFHFFLNKRRFF